MPSVELDGERIVIGTEYRERELVKQIPGARWDSEARTWWCPLSWASCVQLRGVFNGSLRVGSALASWSRAEHAERIGPCLDLRAAEDSPELAERFPKLRPFQRAGVRFLATAGQALIADEMGLGKTVQAIMALELREAYPVLVVAPNSMKLTWQDEYARWAPERRVGVIAGGAVARRKVIESCAAGELDVLVINWEALRLHTRLAPYGSVQLSEADRTPKELDVIQFAAVIADEAHKAKEPRAQQTRALWAVGDRTPVRYALTGTPVANSPEDLWSLLRFVSPLEFPAKTKFLDRYGLQSWNAFGGMQVVGLKSETRDELFRIVDPRFIRRLKAAVLTQLPAKQYATRWVEMGSKQAKSYHAMRQAMVADLEGGVLVATNPLARLTRLLQFASAHGEIVDDQLSLTEPSCKVDALEELLPELGGASVVVFAESRQLIELAATRLVRGGYRVGQITGAVSAGDRQENVRRFQSGDLQVILATLAAGGEGITLHAASTAVFLQRSWSLVKNLQAEDRIHRIGQEADAVEIIDVITTGTAEAKVHAARATKGEMLEEVVRDEQTLRDWLAK